MFRKTVIAFFLVLAISSLLWAQPGAETKNDGRKDLVVFAAASLTESLAEIKTIYEERNPSINLVFNLDSSGTLKTQIEEGAECDLFFSASPKQVDALLEKGLLEESSRTVLLENRTALVVPEGNPRGVNSFGDLADRLMRGEVLLAIGNSDVPVGQYTQRIFSYLGIEEKRVEKALTYGTNVKEVTTQVSSSSVDCGIVYSTDAFSAGLTVVDIATEEMTGGKVLYPAAVASRTRMRNEAFAFLAFLESPEAMEVFSKVGFSPVT